MLDGNYQIFMYRRKCSFMNRCVIEAQVANSVVLPGFDFPDIFLACYTRSKTWGQDHNPYSVHPYFPDFVPTRSSDLTQSPDLRPLGTCLLNTGHGFTWEGGHHLHLGTIWCCRCWLPGTSHENSSESYDRSLDLVLVLATFHAFIIFAFAC